MADRDRIKWEKKYQNSPDLLDKRPASKIVKEFYNFAKKGKALDVASGSGRNSIFLAKKGFVVDSIDISKVAIEKLKSQSKNLNINTILMDLDHFIPDKRYDLIVMANYLDRALIDRLKEYLNVDGIFIVETYMEDKINEKESFNPNFLLKKGELKEIFSDFEILEYREFINEPYEKYRMKKAGIVAKREG